MLIQLQRLVLSWVANLTGLHIYIIYHLTCTALFRMGVLKKTGSSILWGLLVGRRLSAGFWWKRLKFLT